MDRQTEPIPIVPFDYVWENKWFDKTDLSIF